MSTLLQLEDISFSQAARPILHNISFAVQEGTAAALIGPNGAGKTTLLRLIAGSLTPASGAITLNGRALQTIPAKERARLIAVIPQLFELPFDFTVQQVVEQGRTPYLALLRGLTTQDRKAVEEALHLTDLTTMRHRIFNELSGGERQRVKIALALAQQPRLLLLDEPTQNLDIGRQAELMQLLSRLRAEGITLLASIHELHLIPANFSTVHLLAASGTLTTGTPAALLTRPTLAAAFACPPSAVDGIPAIP